MFAQREKLSFGRRLRDLCWPSIGLRRAWAYRMHRLARLQVSPHKLALGFAIGAFSAFTPFLGLHFILAVVLAFILRANVLASALGTVIANPVTLPLIWVATYELGARMLGLHSMHPNPPVREAGVSFLSDGPIAFATALWNTIEPVLWPMLIGAIPLGLVSAVIGYCWCWPP